MESGIYKIVNVINNKFYIGSSKNLNKRFKIHLSELKNNRHNNFYLQKSFNKYGENNFKFEIIENCSKEILLKREQYYIDTLKPEYNLSKFSAEGGDLISYHPNRKEISKKISNSQKNHKRYVGQFTAEKNYNWKGGISKKTEKRICINCSKEFEFIINRKKETCSNSCNISIINKKRYENIKDKGEELKLTCNYCNNNFSWFRKPNVKDIRKFCSRACSNKYMFKNKLIEKWQSTKHF